MTTFQKVIGDISKAQEFARKALENIKGEERYEGIEDRL